MMKKQMQKAVCLLLGSVLLLSMGACGKKDKTSARDVTDGSSVTATQTTQVVREIKSHKGEIGEEMQYQDVDAVMKKAYVSDYTFSENGSEIGLTFFEFEITNNSEDELAVDLLSCSVWKWHACLRGTYGRPDHCRPFLRQEPYIPICPVRWPGNVKPSVSAS